MSNLKALLLIFSFFLFSQVMAQDNSEAKQFIQSLIKEKTNDIELKQQQQEKIIYTEKNVESNLVDTLKGENEQKDPMAPHLVSDTTDTIQTSRKNVIDFERESKLNKTPVPEEAKAPKEAEAPAMEKEEIKMEEMPEDTIIFSKRKKEEASIQKETPIESAPAPVTEDVKVAADHPFAVLFEYDRGTIEGPKGEVDPSWSIDQVRKALTDETKLLRSYSKKESQLVMQYGKVEKGPVFDIMIAESSSPLSDEEKDKLKALEGFKEINNEGTYIYVCCTNKDVATAQKTMDKSDVLTGYTDKRLIAILGNQAINLDKMQGLSDPQLFNIEMNKTVLGMEKDIIENSAKHLESKEKTIHYKKRINELSKDGDKVGDKDYALKLVDLNNELDDVKEMQKSVDNAILYLDNSILKLDSIFTTVVDSLKALPIETPVNE